MIKRDVADLSEAIVEDDARGVINSLNKIGDPNVRIVDVGFRLPRPLRHSPPAGSVAAFFGSVEALRALVNLCFDATLPDEAGRTIVFFLRVWEAVLRCCENWIILAWIGIVELT